MASRYPAPLFRLTNGDTDARQEVVHPQDQRSSTPELGSGLEQITDRPPCGISRLAVEEDLWTPGNGYSGARDFCVASVTRGQPIKRSHTYNPYHFLPFSPLQGIDPAPRRLDAP